MKNIFALLVLTFIFISCDNGGMGEAGPYSLVGTWEASGEFVVEGDQRTYKSTLAFLNETEYKQETHYKSKQGAFDLLDKREGTYVREEENIIFTDYDVSGSTRIGPYTYTYPYRFINKNTLETQSTGVSSTHIGSATFRRK
jgi:hypothetical protein